MKVKVNGDLHTLESFGKMPRIWTPGLVYGNVPPTSKGWKQVEYIRADGKHKHLVLWRGRRVSVYAQHIYFGKCDQCGARIKDFVPSLRSPKFCSDQCCHAHDVAESLRRRS